MERELYFRISALLENLEENVSYIIDYFPNKDLSNRISVTIVDFKFRVGIESKSSRNERSAAREDVDVALGRLKSLVDELNEGSKPLYRHIDKQSPVMDHVNNRFALISRLISEVRSMVDRGDDGQKLVPREAPAPVRVVINNDRLELAAPKTHIGSVPDPSVDKLRIAARDIMRRAMSTLVDAGNADPRFLPCCEGLVIELSSPLNSMSIEAVGINWQIVNEALEISKDSIPDLIIAQIRRALTTISVILGQYEEWQVYLTAEAGTRLSSAEVAALAEQALSLVQEFAQSPEAADIRIADRIRIIIDPVTTGIIQADTIGVPLIGSMSNIFGALSHAALEILPGGATLTGRISGGIVLANLSVLMITKFAPTLSAFPPLSWMAGVHSEITKNWSTVKDVLKI